MNEKQLLKRQAFKVSHRSKTPNITILSASSKHSS